MNVNVILLFFILSGTSAGFDLENALKNQLLSLNSSTPLGSDCESDLIQMIAALKHGENWSWKMVDASTKIPTGISYLGDDIGQFDECINTEYGQISGKYCLGSLKIEYISEESKHSQEVKRRLLQNTQALRGSEKKNIAFKMAACLPSSCSAEKFQPIFNELFRIEQSISPLLPKVSVEFKEDLCSTKHDYEELTTGAIIAIVFFGLVILIMLVQTGYDLYCQQYEKEPSQLYIAFSMYSNSAKLFKMTKNSNQLGCLNGLKFYSMLWVLWGHTYSLGIAAPLMNHLGLLEWASSLHSMILVSGTLSVDTFFVVGGVLVTYSYMQAMEKKVKFNIFIFYLHRYIRLTPALATLALATATIYPYFGNGPNWHTVVADQRMCQDSWWSTILYVQNYASTGEMCLGHSWYLAVDMQLYLLAPLILYGFRKYNKPTILGLILVTLGICGWNFAVVWNEHYSAILSNIYNENSHFLPDFYIKTHVRAGTWICGVILGYYIFEMKQNRLKFKPHKILNIVVWICCIALMLFCIFIGHDSLRTPVYSKWGNSLHIAFIRQLWTLGNSWIIVACIFGYGGPINWFLSLPAYQVFNKFSYSIYLVHYMVITLWDASTKSPIYFSDIVMGYHFWGNLCFTCFISYFWVLAFESPIIILEKIILGPLMNPKRPKTPA